MSIQEPTRFPEEPFLLSNGAQSLLLDTALSISSFGEDEAGEIYVVGLGGTVHRIINPNAPPRDPPTAAVALNGEGFRTGHTITYQATLTPGSTLTLGGYLPWGAPARLF